MGNYLFNTDVLVDLLKNHYHDESDLDFGKNILPSLHKTHTCADIVALLRYSKVLMLAGNHYTAVTDSAFTDAMVELTRISSDRG